MVVGAQSSPAAEDGSEQALLQRHDNWKQKIPIMYNSLMTFALEWPSLTVQWFPEVGRLGDSEIHQLLLGTHTSDEQNYLVLADLMCNAAKSDRQSTTTTDSTVGNISFDVGEQLMKRLRIRARFQHLGEVNRARYMPQCPKLIATKSPSSDVLLFRVPDEPSLNMGSYSVRLRGHTKEGYGLSWSTLKKGHLLSSSEDCTICLWDTNNPGITVDAMARYVSHRGSVEDVAWHLFHEAMFGSAGGDKCLAIWDTRSQGYSKPTHLVEAHNAEVNCLSFNPYSEFILATGSADRTVKLWDLRNIRYRLHSFEWHKDEVFQVQWSPHNETILASSSTDRNVFIWDLSKIGNSQAHEHQIYGPPEFIFSHSGHLAKVSDFAWNPNRAWTVCSVAEDNICQIWEVSDLIRDPPDN